MLIGTLVVAGLVKLAASSMIVSAGWRGGFIIPLFFMGVVFGSAAAQGLGTDRTLTMAALMVACNVGVTKTIVGSTLVVAEMGGMPLLPPVLVAGMVSLFLTSRVSMIETQRDRQSEVRGARIVRRSERGPSGPAAKPPRAEEKVSCREPLPSGPMATPPHGTETETETEVSTRVARNTRLNAGRSGNTGP